MLERWSKGQKIALTIGAVFFGMSCCVFSVAGGYFFTQGGWNKLFGDGEASGEAKVEASAEDVAQIASYLPTDAGGYVWMESTKVGLESLGHSMDFIKRSDDSPNSQDVAESMETLRETLGVELSEPSSWKKSGLVLGAPMGAAIDVRGDEPGATVVIRVADNAKFTDWLKQASDEALVEKSVDGRDYLYSPDGDAAWAFGDGLVVVGAADAGTFEVARKFVDRAFEAGEASGSIQDDEGFQAFRDALATSGGMAFYLPPDGPLADMLFEQIEGEIRADLGDEGVDVMQKVRKAVVGAGLGMHAEGPARGSTRMWVGLDETGREMARQLTTATRSFEWSNVVTDETMMAFRVATRPERIWEEIKSAMPAEDRREMESSLKMAQTALGGDFDFERDVVGKLSGQVGLVVYEIGGMGAMMQAGAGNPAGALEKIKAGFLLQFEDAAAAEKLMDTAKQGMAAAGMALSKESADGLDGATVYSLQRPVPISVYHQDGALFVVPGPMEASKVASILGGEETKVDGMGQRFVERDHVNGFYLDANRIKAEMGEMAAEQMKNWKAMALYSYVDDAGAWVELNWELDPGAISEDGGE